MMSLESAYILPLKPTWHPKQAAIVGIQPMQELREALACDQSIVERHRGVWSGAVSQRLDDQPVRNDLHAAE